MDYAATQILEEEEDFECTQRISQAFVEKELTQVIILFIYIFLYPSPCIIFTLNVMLNITKI